MARPGDMVPRTSTDGAAIQVPLDDEIRADRLPGALPLHPPFGLVESLVGSEADRGVDWRNLGGLTPKRPGGDLEAPSPRRVRTESQ